MAKLKVFTWSDGFHAFTVATTSKPKALEAWGIGADIFKSGLASEITTGPDHDAALASPGEVIQRGQAIDVGEVSKAPKPKSKPARASDPDADERASKAAAAKAQAALDALEANLAALDARQDAERADIDSRRAALDAEESAMNAAHRKARREITDAIKAAQKAL